MLNRQRAGRVTHVPRVEAVVCREATPLPG